MACIPTKGGGEAGDGSPIARAFAAAGKRAALIPFVTAGFPRADSTVGMLRALQAAGADIIEVGVPFSDPMADGPAIARANLRALQNGATLSSTLAQVAAFRQGGGKTPVVLMGYANSFVNFGIAAFARRAAKAGVNGVIVVDLADSDRQEWQAALGARGIALPPLLAPTTPPARMRAIARAASGFLYFISLRGVTGAKTLNANNIAAACARIRKNAAAPLVVGFGVREPAQAAEIARFADGVVIGSRLTELAEAAAPAKAAEAVGRFLRQVARALAAPAAVAPKSGGARGKK